MTPETGDRLRGSLLGLAAGDRNGGPTQMTVRLAESLVDLHRFDSEDVFHRYLTWWRQEGFDTGPVADLVFRAVEAGTSRADAVQAVHRQSGRRTAGCNPAHRSPPLAMAGFLSDADLPRLAAQEASLTHHDPLAGDVAAATVALCRSLALGTPWTLALDEAAIGRTELTRNAIAHPASKLLDSGGFAPEVLRASISFLRANDNFESALNDSLNFAGSANYCPVLVGAIGGARWGASTVPSHFLPKAEILSRIAAAADALVRSWP